MKAFVKTKKGQTLQDVQNEILSSDVDAVPIRAVSGCLVMMGFTAGVLLIVIGLSVFVLKMISAGSL
jgi:hypothetical protein